MKQKKVDLSRYKDPDLGYVITLSDHVYKNDDRPLWAVSLTETEFCELAEQIYVEYCFFRRINGTAPIRANPQNRRNDPVGKIGDHYYISINVYWDLTHSGRTPEEFELTALRRLMTVRADRDDLLCARQFAIAAAHVEHARAMNVVIQEEKP